MVRGSEGTEGYGKAEVTAGGVRYRRIVRKNDGGQESAGLFSSEKWWMSTGQLGGFNFQWAWASGASAGRAL